MPLYGTSESSFGFALKSLKERARKDVAKLEDEEVWYVEKAVRNVKGFYIFSGVVVQVDVLYPSYYCSCPCSGTSFFLAWPYFFGPSLRFYCLHTYSCPAECMHYSSTVCFL